MARGLTIGKVAKAAGLPKCTAHYSLRAEHASEKRINQFAALGIPKRLLPKPWPKTRTRIIVIEKESGGE